MRLFETSKETTQYSEDILGQNKSIGFVPTMGALHAGHLALVKRAKEENPYVCVSIFVNPIQFNNPADLEKYPRNLQKDLELLSEVLSDRDYVFAPLEDQIYPNKETKKYDFGSLEKIMEGEHRPGHFNGVGVVVDRLFRIVKPNKAYFGEKDFQQLAIIRKLTEIEKLAIAIVPCAIVREEDGLAMSSRNVRLTETDRKSAWRIHTGLRRIADKAAQGEDLDLLANALKTELNAIPNYRVEYISFAKESDLSSTKQLTNGPVRCFIAVFAGKVRLIDNLPLY